MDGSTGFHDSMQANNPYLYQPLSQPMGQNQQFQGKLLSQTMGQNQPFQGKPSSEPMIQNQAFHAELLSQSMGQNQHFQGERLSHPMGQNQPIQGERLCQPMGQNQPFKGETLSQPMGQNQPFLGERLSQPMGQNQPFQGEPLSQQMGLNQPFQGEPLSQPMGLNQPFQGESSSQPLGPNQPFQGKPLSQPMGLNHPFQGEPSSNIFTVQASYNTDDSIHVLGNGSHGNSLKWTDEMARLLITAISYLAVAESSEPNNDACSRKLTLIPKLTMWKVMSMVMGERGFNVSPQQCEDKFRDINNKYKQLIGLLGGATSCKVVENPILLDSIGMPENKKEEVRKLLWSEQFLYREMCSFHYGNRMFLPHDWELRRSVFLNLANNCVLQKQKGNQNETGGNQDESKVLRGRWVELEEKSLEIQKQRLQLEKARFEWLCSNRNEVMKLKKMRLENESLKLENARMACELKRREINSSVGISSCDFQFGHGMKWFYSGAEW